MDKDANSLLEENVSGEGETGPARIDRGPAAKNIVESLQPVPLLGQPFFNMTNKTRYGSLI